MIRKLLLTSALLISSVIIVKSQCTPDLLCTSLVCPDTITNLPHATATVLYNTTITVLVPADTVMPPYGNITVDSLNYTSITGLPTGFTAIPDKSGWPGGSAGCVLITGTTTNAQYGTHPLIINVTAHAMSGFATVPLVITGYKIVVDTTTGISIMNFNKFSLAQNSPNPFSAKTTIGFIAPNAEKYQFTVYNVLGDVVYAQAVNAVAGENKIEFSASAVDSGIYMYKLSNKTQTITKRMIVSRK